MNNKWNKQLFIVLIMTFFLAEFFTVLGKDLHEILQIEGTEENILKFFNHKKIDKNLDYLYLFLLPPSSCPRCESAISVLADDIKKIEPNSKIYLVVFYRQTNALLQYLKIKNFKVDTTFIEDPDSPFLNNFWISTRKIQIPYVTKFSRKSGVLLHSKGLLGNLTDSLIKSIVAQKEGGNRHFTYKYKIERNNDVKGPISDLGFYKVKLKPSQNFKILDNGVLSLPLLSSMSVNENFLVTQDDLSQKIFLFKKEKKDFVFYKEIAPTEKEIYQFFDKDIGKELLNYLKEMNFIVPMFFKPSWEGKKLFITASLPKIFWVNKTDSAIGTMNIAAFCVKDAVDSNFSQVFEFKLPDSLLGAVSHINASYIPELKLFFLPIEKGWPLTGTSTDDLKNPALNPFNNDFYKSNSLFAIFDAEGKFIKTVGHLDEVYKRLKLGYSYVNQTIFYNGKHFFVSDGASGKIFVYSNIDLEKPIDTLVIFNPDFANFQFSYDYQVNPLEYIFEFKNVFQYSIRDIIGNYKEVACFIHFSKDPDKASFCKVDLSTKKVKFYELPKNLNGAKLVNPFLHQINNKLYVYGFYLKNNLWELKLFELQ